MADSDHDHLAMDPAALIAEARDADLDVDDKTHAEIAQMLDKEEKKSAASKTAKDE